MAKPAWVVTCTNCDKTFMHSPISDEGNLGEFFLPSKPAMPEGGESLECPHCKTVDCYQRTDLRYETFEG